MYFSELQIAKQEDPLGWWKGRFPNLSKLARSFLCIPATSTPAEWIFSAAGNIFSQKRASLSHEHVDMLTFLILIQHLFENVRYCLLNALLEIKLLRDVYVQT